MLNKEGYIIAANKHTVKGIKRIKRIYLRDLPLNFPKNKKQTDEPELSKLFDKLIINYQQINPKVGFQIHYTLCMYMYLLIDCLILYL